MASGFASAVDRLAAKLLEDDEIDALTIGRGDREGEFGLSVLHARRSEPLSASAPTLYEAFKGLRSKIEAL